MLTQETVREKMIEKCEGIKIKYMAEKTKIPREILSKFKNGRRELYQESLEVLNDFLDGLG